MLLTFILACLSLVWPLHSPAHQTHIVKMEGMEFVPKTIEIKVGDAICWINESKMQHNAVAKDKSFTSTMLNKGEQFTVVFTKAGTFDYYCQPHKMMGMKGVVIVK